MKVNELISDADDRQDTFGDRVRAVPIEQSAERVTVSQGDHPELQNHVGVRHASALFAGAYEASRLLIAGALAASAVPGDMRLVESHVDYTNLPMGEILTTAEPSGEAWLWMAAELSAGQAVSLAVSAVSRVAGVHPVATLHTTWHVWPTD